MGMKIQTLGETEMLLYSILKTGQGSLLVQPQKSRWPTTSSSGVFVSNEIDAALTEARRKPVTDAVVDRVQGAVRAVDGNARGGAAQQGRLERVGEGHGREGFEDRWVVRDDHRRGQR